MLNWISSLRSKNDASSTLKLLEPGAISRKAISKPTQDCPDPSQKEALDVWGFVDTRFQTDANGIVEVTGARYPLSGQKLPGLLPWFSNLMEVEITGSSKLTSSYPPPIPEVRINDGIFAEIQGFLRGDQISLDGEVRLRHGHGHTQGEMFALKHAAIGRIPDIVVYPDNESEIENIVRKQNLSD